MNIPDNHLHNIPANAHFFPNLTILRTA